MSYFSVMMDSVEIYDPDYPEMTLVNASCTAAVGEAGSMDFTFPAKHVFAKNLIPYGSTIEVFEDGVSVFYGRPLPPSIDIFGQRKIHCEGAMAFLGDVVCPANAPGLSLPMNDGEYFVFLINYYNSMQVRNDRKLTIGSAPSGGVSRIREWSYRTCLEELRNNILPYIGGYIFTRRQGGLTYIDWVTDFTQNAGQPISLGLNMVDVTRTGKQFFTAALAKGAEDVRMTSPITLSAEIMHKYGFICASLDYPSVTDLATLQGKCNTFLTRQQFGETEFDISAVDLHILNDQYGMLKIGQRVTVKFSEFESTVQIPIKSIQTDINTGVKKITVAYPSDVEVKSYVKSGTLTGIQAESIQAIDLSMQDIGSIEYKIPEMVDLANPTGEYIYLKDPDGNTIAISLQPTQVPVIDPETGEPLIDPETGEPIMEDDWDILTEEIPEESTIEENPDNPPPETYEPGDVFDPSQYQIINTFGDGTTAVSPEIPTFNIPDGYTFTGTTADPTVLTMSQTIAGQTFTDSLDISTGADQHYIESITFTRTYNGSYRIGDTFDASQYEVSAVYADGTTEVVTDNLTFSIPDGYVFGDEHPSVYVAYYVINDMMYRAETTLRFEEWDPELNTPIYVEQIYEGYEYGEYEYGSETYHRYIYDVEASAPVYVVCFPGGGTLKTGVFISTGAFTFKDARTAPRGWSPQISIYSSTYATYGDADGYIDSIGSSSTSEEGMFGVQISAEQDMAPKDAALLVLKSLGG